MELFEAIKTRRSVRRFKDTPVDEALLVQLMDSVRRSPSWANMQCWKFVIVRDPLIKLPICEYSYVEAFFAPLGYKANPSKRGLCEAPVIIAACADPARSGNLWDKPYYMTDIGIAAQTLMLAARALGLGTVFVGVFEEERIKDILRIPNEIRVVGLFPLGYPLEEEKAPGPRKELNEILYWERWG